VPASERDIPVSPLHSVRLAEPLAALVAAPPDRDYVVRTLVKREANGLPLMSADLVIAGAGTREAFPLTAEFPLHFRKRYFPGCLHGDPRVEARWQERASGLIGVPGPLGATAKEFRGCFVPGVPFHRASPLGIEPQHQNIERARQLPLASAAGLWRLLEEALAAFRALHAGGMVHGDAERHNLIVSPAPLGVVLVDFERAAERGGDNDEAWAARCRRDLEHLAREAVYLQCALGRQSGDLADLSWALLDTLVTEPDRFRRAIARTGEMG
jgi:hypothetical protein